MSRLSELIPISVPRILTRNLSSTERTHERIKQITNLAVNQCNIHVLSRVVSVEADSPHQRMKKQSLSVNLFFPSQSVSQSVRASKVLPHSLLLSLHKRSSFFLFLFFSFFLTLPSPLIPTPDPTDPTSRQPDPTPLSTVAMDILQCYHNSRLLVDWSDKRMWLAVASIVFNPTFWNIVARKGLSFFCIHNLLLLNWTLTHRTSGLDTHDERRGERVSS